MPRSTAREVSTVYVVGGTQIETAKDRSGPSSNCDSERPTVKRSLSSRCTATQASPREVSQLGWMMCSPSGHLHPQSSPKPGRGERGEGSKKGLDCLGRRLAVEGTPPTTLAPPLLHLCLALPRAKRSRLLYSFRNCRFSLNNITGRAIQRAGRGGGAGVERRWRGGAVRGTALPATIWRSRVEASETPLTSVVH